MSRADFLKRVEEAKTGVIEDIKVAELKGFCKRYIGNFVDVDEPEAVASARAVLYDYRSTMNDFYSAIGSTSLIIETATIRQLFDLCYAPLSSASFKKFSKAVKNGVGTGSLVLVCGKRALLLTNKPIDAISPINYQTIRLFDDNVPDVHIIPWYIVEQQKWKVW